VPNPANPQSLNRYSYCLNNPTSRIDPSGNEDQRIDNVRNALSNLSQYLNTDHQKAVCNEMLYRIESHNPSNNPYGSIEINRDRVTQFATERGASITVLHQDRNDIGYGTDKNGNDIIYLPNDIMSDVGNKCSFELGAEDTVVVKTTKDSILNPNNRSFPGYGGGGIAGIALDPILFLNWSSDSSGLRAHEGTHIIQGHNIGPSFNSLYKQYEYYQNPYEKEAFGWGRDYWGNVWSQMWYCITNAFNPY